jgi:hypothetical protein
MDISSGSLKEIVLPKGIKIKKLDLRSAPELENIENAEKVKQMDIPISTGCKFVRKAIKFPGKITMNGFGPY